MESQRHLDTGLCSIVTLAQFHQIPADAKQLEHHFKIPNKHFSSTEIILAARSVGLKAKLKKANVGTLSEGVLPLIAQCKSGRFIIIAKIKTCESEDGIESILIQDFLDKGPKIITVDELDQLWNGQVIAVSKRNDSGFTSKKFDISWFIPSIVKYKGLFINVVIAAFFLQLFALVTPLLFQVVMDKVLVHQGFTTLNVLAIGFLFVIVFEVVLGGLKNYVFTHTTNRVDVELGSRLYSHLLKLPLSYFESRQVGQNVARVRELDTIRNFITGSALTLTIDIFFVFIFIGVMWLYSPKLTWVVLATIPAYAILSILITPTLRKRLNEKFKFGAQNTAFLTESITGISTVKSMALEPQMKRNLEGFLSGYVNASFKSQNLGNIAGQFASLINKLMVLGIIWIGAHQVIAQEITVGQLVAFNMLAGRLSSPILKLVQLWQDFQQAGISVQRLGDILNSTQEPNVSAGSSKLDELKGQITFKNVSFRYKPSQPLVLKNTNFTFEAGDIVGIVGRSGSGKSTLSKILQKFYTPEDGRVLIDNVDISMLETPFFKLVVAST